MGIGNGKTTQQPQTLVTNDAPLSRSAAVPSQPLTADMYLQAIRTTVSQTYYPRGYAWFRGYGSNPTLDYINEFARTQRYDLTAALINTSFAINENYNIFRTAKKASLRTAAMQANPTFSTAAIDGLVANQFDALQIDWLKDIPRNQYTMDWSVEALGSLVAPGQLFCSLVVC